VDVGHAPSHRVLDGDHGELRFAGLHRGERVLECGAGIVLHVRIGIARGQVRVGAGLALEGDFVQARSGHGLDVLGSGRSLRGLKNFPRPRKVGRSIDTERDSVNEADMDTEAVLKRAQLLQLLPCLER
jgi:hypothetical protein